MGARAFLNGVLDIAIKPVKGWLKSSTRKIADDAESAQTNSAATIVRFGRAKRPKLTKIIVSQNTSTATNGLGIALADCAKKNARLSQIDTDLNCPGLHLTLSIVLRRQFKQLIEEQFRLGARFERYRLCGCRLLPAPNPFD